MQPQADPKEALRVLSLAVEFMEWKTFEGGRRERFNAALPLKKDGLYHYDDGKIDIAYDVNTRPHRIDTFLKISVIRGSWLRKRDLVFDAENSRVEVFRPGLWVEYVADLAESARSERRAADEVDWRLQEEAALRAQEERGKNFIPIDDSAIFNK
jgi:hypothetical protein